MRPARGPMRAVTLAHADQLFPADLSTRMVARRLYDAVRSLPLLAVAGTADVRLFEDNAALSDPARLLVQSSPYVVGVLYGHGVALEELGIVRRDGRRVEGDAREIWRRFAENYHLFRGTPLRMWLDHTFSTSFGLNERLSLKTADLYFERMTSALSLPEMRPRALLVQHKIEAIANPENPLDELRHYAALRESGWKGRVVPTYQPDALIDPLTPGFTAHLDRFGEVSSCDTRTWRGYLEAHQKRRAYFKSMGAFASAHRPPSARTADLAAAEAERLFDKIVAQQATADEQDAFRGQMLTEMARMSLDDGLVMQVSPGWLHHLNLGLADQFGEEYGPDLGRAVGIEEGLRPLLNRFGNERKLHLVVFANDVANAVRELAPLAGHYPALRIGADSVVASPQGLRRFREMTTGVAGVYNTLACCAEAPLLLMPAQHDLARRADCAYLAELVMSHQLDEDDAFDLAQELAYGLVKRAYKL